jgi:hypothetical protein
MAGRKPGFKMTDEHRSKIANSQVLNRLIDHVTGAPILEPSQVTAAVALLKKVMPDLQSVESKSEVTMRNVVEMPAPAKSVEDWRSTVPARH